MEAEAETGDFFGVGGFWISNDGKECQITKMFVDRFVRWFKGEADPDNLLGNSVESAMSAVEKWIYDLDHPLAGQPARSTEQQRLDRIERAFYEAFLEKLKNLSGSAGKDSQNVSNYASNAGIVPQKLTDADEEKAAGNVTAAFDTFGAYAPDEVRQAWKEAEEATGGHFAAGGLWISNDGKHAHATQIMLERAGSWLRGEKTQYNILGNSVESAINFAEKAIYSIDHPLAGQPTKSIEQQRLTEMERKFYESFLDKLRQLS